MRFTLLIYFLLGFTSVVLAQSRFTISGYVHEQSSQQALIGVSVYVPGTSLGTTTNTYGFYSLTIPAQDSLTLLYSFVGYETITHTLPLHRNFTLNVGLPSAEQALSEVVVNAGSIRNRLSDNAQMSQIEVSAQQAKKLPALLGEKDIIRVLQLMPGVQKGSEGSTGLYVRGGGPDQNLLMLDDATVYNANHLFGFFSVFNGNALKSVEMTKGGFPARYGGRLSSVIEINTKEGNKQEMHAEGGIGLISSHLTLEGPIQRGRSSFLISGRRTYFDLVSRPFAKTVSAGGMAMSGYYFYDLNGKINYDLGHKNKLYLSGYFGRDQYEKQDAAISNTRANAGLNWGNATASLRWNHLFSERLFSNASLLFSQYNFNIAEQQRRVETDYQSAIFNLRYQSAIRDFAIKYDLDFYPSPTHAIRFGLKSTYHRITPSAIVLKDAASNNGLEQTQTNKVLESGIYAEDNWRPNNHWRVNGGIRLSHFLYKERQYLRPEPRLSMAYMITPDLSVKASYAIMNQYIHLLSNTGTGFPTDLWVPATDRVKPQRSKQAAIGVVKDFTGDNTRLRGITLSLEGYYKTMDDIINYQEGASFLMLKNLQSANKVSWEDNVTSGKGWSYGTEFLAQKKSGRFTGWVGYTLAWTQWQFAALNGGKKFYPRYDRRHDISVVGMYEFNKRVTLSATWVYGTGNALTVPVGRYNAAMHEGNVNQTKTMVVQTPFDEGSPVIDYAGKNTFRAEAYHRMDVSLRFYKQKKHGERTWELSIYNLYNRRNPFFYELGFKDNGPKQSTTTALYKYSVFPIMPSVSYNFKF